MGTPIIQMRARTPAMTAATLTRIIHEMRHLPVRGIGSAALLCGKALPFREPDSFFLPNTPARLSLAECSEVEKRALAESRRLSAQQSGKAAVGPVRFINKAD